MKFWASNKKVIENKPKQAAAPTRHMHHYTKPLAVLMLCVVFTYATYRLNDALAVSHWDIQANPSLTQQIEHFLQAQQYMDFWHSRAARLQAHMLQSIPDIERLEVRRVLPHGLYVQAIARVPLALWVNHGEDEVMLVDQDAQAYRPLKVGESMDLPLLRLAADDVKPAVQLLQKIAQETDRIASLSEIIVEHRRWRLNFSHGAQWQLVAGNMQQDMEKIMGILDQPRWNHGHWRMDARIPQRWFIRPAMQEVI